MPNIEDVYSEYIACLNARTLDKLSQFVNEDVIHNGEKIGLAGYKQMLQRDMDAIPDLKYDVTHVVANDQNLASRIFFSCKPTKPIFGFAPNGKKIEFHENVFYWFKDGKISQVWSIVDKHAIQEQLKEDEPYDND